MEELALVARYPGDRNASVSEKNVESRDVHLRMENYLGIPRIMIAALRGGAGKTFLTAGIVAALRRRGLSPAVFKKGPDYIDAGWLGLAAGRDCYNLDTYLMDREIVKRSFLARSFGTGIAVLEGNRGLFDGVDPDGTYSTAELAKLLHTPVLLIIDATKMTRTAAALVLGCIEMDPLLDLKGIILNRVAGARHERILRESIEQATGLKVIGSVPKYSATHFPQRHLGLVPLYEHPLALQLIERAADLIEGSVDLDALVETARDTHPLPWDASILDGEENQEPSRSLLRVGVLRDSAFQFYYPENLEALRRAAGPLIEVSALEPTPLPELDALYIGGGFPETHAERLGANSVFRESLRVAVEQGLPVYAECGGLMYLSRSLVIDESVYPMAGVFPIDSVLEKKPKGLGYVRVQVERANPFYSQGTVLNGHEFHYSSVPNLHESEACCVFRILRGHGMDGTHDGICRFNALGTYMHIHALGEPLWAQGILATALRHRRARDESSGAAVREIKVSP